MAYKKTTDIHFVSLSSYTRPEIVEDKRKEYVAYGENNDHFNYLIRRYTGSTTNQAIIDGKARLIYGKGLSATDKAKKIEDWTKLKVMLADDDLQRAIFDYALLEHCAFLVTRKNGKTKVTHWPMETLRAAKMGESDNGEIKRWFYHPNWSERKGKTGTDDLEVFYSYESGSDREEQILVIKRYVPGYYYYNVVSYEAAIAYALLEEEIADYLINDVQNGFSGTKVVNFNNGLPSPEEQKKIVRDVEAKLTGARGMKTIVAFNRDETKKTTVDDIPLNDAPAHYQYLAGECEAKLLKGHKAPSVLLGFNADSAGFSNNAEELRNKMLAFDNYVIKPFQHEILSALEWVLADEEISLNLFFETLEPIEFSDVPQVQEEQQQLTLAAVESHLPDLKAFIEKGEWLDGEWEMIDEREVDYELEEELDAQVREWEASLQPKDSLLKKAWNFISTGVARPKTKSEQDAQVGDFYYRVRYRYDKPAASVADEISKAATSGQSNKHRPFCIAMERAGKLYRKEDIQALSDKVVNPGFGPNGSDTYDVWKYKGGPWCGHRWVRVTFKNTSRFKTLDEGDQISNAQAEREGYRVRNEPEVSVPPRFMPNNGYK